MSKEYDQFTDEELIERLREGEADITDYICDKYKSLVRSKAKSMFILGADKEDLIQEGMIGLFKAVRDYRTDRNTSFLTFADLCISRQMYSAILMANRKKHGPLNSYISLNATAADSQQDADGICNLWNLSLEQVNDPEQIMIARESLDHLLELISQELSTFEKQVLDLYLTGMPYTQIAKVLGKDAKATDNALQRIKTKLKKAMK